MDDNSLNTNIPISKTTDYPHIAVVCLTADPIHLGHEQLVQRALAATFEKVIVGIAAVTNKNTLFTTAERFAMAQKVFAPYGEAVETLQYDGTTIDFVASKRGRVILRGIRSTHDFQYEADLAYANRQLSVARHGYEIDTMLILANQQKTHISSSLIRSFASVGCNEQELEPYVRPLVAKALVAKHHSS